MSFTTRPELRGTVGAVASTHWLASASGMAILEKGGNAFDAAVAAGFVLQVVEPHLNGPAGEAVILLHDRREAGPQVICGQGPAPRAATIAHFRSLGLDRIPGTGLLPAVVPGAFDAWMLLLRDHGSLHLRDVLAPAIGYAAGGYPLVPRIADTIRRVADLFREAWATSAAVYLPGGDVPAAGTLFRNPRLAATYRRLVDEAERRDGGREGQIQAARESWSQGFVAEAIGRFCRTREVVDATGRPHGGLLDEDDMARWQATKEAPVVRDYAGYTVCKPGPWSQGPVFLQQLALLEGFDLAAMDPDGPEFVHTAAECAKLALADREAFYGDPAFVDVPLDALLSADYTARRRGLVGARASFELRPGTIEGYGFDLARILRASGERDAAFDAPGGGEPTVQGPASGDTCHLDVIDRHGNVVTATPSGGWLQASPVIPELGFPLNTRAQMFWLDEGAPSALAPGKRPRTTLSASLALRAGVPLLAWGTPGGDYQDQWSLIFFLRHVHHGMNLQEAIDAPMFQSDHAPSSFHPRQVAPGRLSLEDRFPRATIDELKRRGHDVEVADGWSLGRLSAAGRAAEGQIKAGANPRFMQGYAVAR